MFFSARYVWKKVLIYCYKYLYFTYQEPAILTGMCKLLRATVSFDFPHLLLGLKQTTIADLFS